MKYRITKTEVFKRTVIVEVPDGTDYDTVSEMAYEGEFEDEFFGTDPRQDELWYDTEECDGKRIVES